MNQGALCDLLQTSSNTVRKWEGEGLPRDPGPDGRTVDYDLGKVARWLALRLARKQEAVTPDGESLEAAKRREQIARANLAEMDQGQRAGELCRVAEVTAALTDIGAQVRLGLERVPDKLADRLAAEAGAEGARRLLTAELDLVVDELTAAAARLAGELEGAAHG